MAAAASSLMMAPPARAAASSAFLDRSETKLVQLINKLRARHGRRPLRVSPRLNRAADRHSWEMIAHRYFAHPSSNGASASRRVRGFRPSRRVGENIAFVARRHKRRAIAVYRAWLHSPGHLSVMLQPHFRRVGVGRRYGKMDGRRGFAYTADFASKR